MSTVTPIIDSVEDLWPAEGARAGRWTSSSWPRICSAPTARSRTSAAATRRPRASRPTTPAARWRRCGSRAPGSDLATMGPEHFTALRLDEMLPLMERDEMSDEDMVAYLVALPARPRGPALLDRDAAARLRPRAARAPHAPGRDQRARRHRRRRAARARVLRRRGGVDPLHPPGLHVVQAGRRGRPRQPRPEARGPGQARPDRLGRHGRGGLPQDDRGHQPGRRVRQHAHGRQLALRRAQGRRLRVADRAAARDPRRGFLRAREGPDRRHVRARDGVRLLRAGRAAREGRRPVPGSPRAHQAPAAVDLARGRHAGADRRAGRRVPRELPRLLRRSSRATATSPATRTRGSSWSRAWAWSPRAPRPSSRRSRAISTTARSRSWRAPRRWASSSRWTPPSPSPSSTGRWSSTSSRRRRRPASCRARSRSSPAARAASAARSSRRSPPRGRAWSLLISTATGAQDAVAEYGDRGLAVAGDVTSEEAVAAAYTATVEQFGGVDIVVSNAGSPPARRSRRRRWPSGTATTRSSARATSSSPARPSACSSARTWAARSSSSPPRTPSSRARTPRRTHRPRPPSSTSRGAWPRRAARTGIRVNTVNPDAVLQGSKIWGSSWREERAAAYDLAPEDLDEHYRQRNTLKLSIYPGDIAEAVLHFASERRSGKSTGNLLNVDGGVPAAYAR